MNYYVYVLGSEKKPKTTYVGWTNNLKNRLLKHNLGKGAKFTRGKKWKVIYKKTYNTKSDAMKNDPEEYGLSADYFDTLNSLNQLVIDAQNNNLGEEDKEKFEAGLETRNRSRTANPFADVNELLEDIKKRHMRKSNK